MAEMKETTNWTEKGTGADGRVGTDEDGDATERRGKERKAKQSKDWTTDLV